MALKATIFKAVLEVADLERSYYGSHTLTIARHPSETDERMMMRILAFAMNAGEALAFASGLSADDEPDLWQKDLSGTIERWIEVGLPDEKSIRRACGRAAEVLVYTYGGARAELWWKANGEALARHANLGVTEIAQESSQSIARFAQRSMTLHCTIQDGQVWLSNGRDVAQIEPVARASPRRDRPWMRE